jgi:hypothetical protein
MESGSPEDAQAASEEEYVQGENGMLTPSAHMFLLLLTFP